MDRILAVCSCVVPCEKFSLATVIPARMSRLMVSIDEVAGPMVQTIFVFVFSELNSLCSILHCQGESANQLFSLRN